MGDEELNYLSTTHKRVSIGGCSIQSKDGGRQQCKTCFSPMLQKNQEPCGDSTILKSVKYALSLPPHDEIATALTWIIAVPMFWVILYSITGDEALPGGNLFSILTLLLLAQVSGYIVSFLHLPPLFGMLLAGVAVRSLPGLNIIGSNIDGHWSATLRKTALVVILTKAGLGLDPKALKELSVIVLRVGVFPNLVETTVVAVISHFLLDFPWLWSFMLGFVMAGVSPSVVVPCILGLSDDGYGLDKGVPTLVIAGLSVDNVISITGFGVMLGLIFSEGSIVWQVFKGPLEILVGIGFGIVMGTLLWYLPNRREKGFSKFRFVLLLSCGLFAVFGSKKIGFAGCGPLGVLATSFVAAIGWRKQGWMTMKCPIKKNFNFVWKFCLPLLFGLIGTEIEISVLNPNTVGFGLLTLGISLVCRFIVTYFAVMGPKFNIKERIFIAISWLPKATIQAAIGSVALDTARHARGDALEESKEEILGKQLLTIAVLAIIAAAPLGAVAIMLSGPRLLKKQEDYSEIPLEEKIPMQEKNGLLPEKV